MPSLGVGVIGLGVGERHLMVYQSHDACKVVAVADFLEEKRKEISGKYPGVSVYEDADAVLTNKEINLVSIASYDNYHCDQIVKALDNGKNVFAEKPLCLSVEEALRIKSALDRNRGLSLSCNFVLRTSPRFEELRKQILNGDIGDIFSIEGDYNYGRIYKILNGWRGKLPFYSVIYGGAVHVVDLILWLTKKKVVEVSAYGNKIATKGTDFKYNDCVVGLLKFEDEMIAKVSANFACVHPHFHCLKVYGTNATFVNDRPHGRLYKSSDPEEEHKPVETAYKGVDKGRVLTSFVDSIIGKTLPMVGVNEIFDVMSVCFAMEEAVNTGKIVKVKYI